MTNEQFNQSLRELVINLIQDGYKKHHICSLTLGAQSGAQFDKFIQGDNMGIKPLQRILDAFDCDLMIVPVKKNDVENNIKIEEITKEFLNNAKQLLINNLDNTDIVSKATTYVSTQYKDFVAEIIAKINE